MLRGPWKEIEKEDSQKKRKKERKGRAVEKRKNERGKWEKST